MDDNTHTHTHRHTHTHGKIDTRIKGKIRNGELQLLFLFDDMLHPKGRVSLSRRRLEEEEVEVEMEVGEEEEEEEVEEEALSNRTLSFPRSGSCIMHRQGKGFECICHRRMREGRKERQADRQTDRERERKKERKKERKGEREKEKLLLFSLASEAGGKRS